MFRAANAVALRRRLFLASLLLAERLDAVDELGHAAHHAAHDLRNEDFLARQIRQSLHARLVEVSAVANAALDRELLRLLGELAQDLRGGDHVVVRERDCRRAFEMSLHPVDAATLDREVDHRILDDRVLHARLAQLVAQLGVFRDRQTAIVNEHDRLRAAELILQTRDDRFLAFNILGHIQTPHIPVQYDGN